MTGSQDMSHADMTPNPSLTQHLLAFCLFARDLTQNFPDFLIHEIILLDFCDLPALIHLLSLFTNIMKTKNNRQCFIKIGDI